MSLQDARILNREVDNCNLSDLDLKRIDVLSNGLKQEFTAECQYKGCDKYATVQCAQNWNAACALHKVGWRRKGFVVLCPEHGSKGMK